MRRALAVKLVSLAEQAQRAVQRRDSVSIREVLLRDDPERLARVLEVLFVAGQLNRYCQVCVPTRWTESQMLQRLAEVECETPMPWDFCASCGVHLQSE